MPVTLVLGYYSGSSETGDNNVFIGFPNVGIHLPILVTGCISTALILTHLYSKITLKNDYVRVNGTIFWCRQSSQPIVIPIIFVMVD
ncbi:MAG: hypothetical protein U5L72_01620 [Bacteroidales bacterium]|nr:hypothetical protein [Bacteroidales bacterium]